VISISLALAEQKAIPASIWSALCGLHADSTELATKSLRFACCECPRLVDLPV